MSQILKERRCENCECNTLRQYQHTDTESHTNWRITQWFCHDCADFVETKLVEIDWRKKECNSVEIKAIQARADRRLETIQRMKRESFERLERSV
tara:strand:+ start:41818 stop:42102 length:285 start_codon:yes stop_codon:yes gene_type:complete